MSAPMSAKRCFLFVGNPGAGKSTLINGVCGKAVFKSGDSYDGSGVTFEFNKTVVEDFGVFMDTPGLSDLKKKEQAAKAITEALKQDGFYRIFFVLTIEAGRIKKDDKVTMQLILEAAPTITDYNVIVNKVDAKWLEKLQADPEKRQGWLTTLNSGLPTLTASVHFMCRDESLASADDNDLKEIGYTAPKEIIRFIKHAPGMVIDSKDVTEVNTDQFEKLEKEYEALLLKLEQDKEAMQFQMQSQKKDMDIAVKKAEKAAEAAKAEADRVAAEAEEKCKDLIKEKEAAKAEREKAIAEITELAKAASEKSEKERAEEQQRAEAAREAAEHKMELLSGQVERAQLAAEIAKRDAQKGCIIG